jgi:hypothetical protein
MAEKRSGPEGESEAARTSRGLAEAAQEAEEKQLDETVPGGKYLLSDGETMVNADGKPLDQDKKD